MVGYSPWGRKESDMTEWLKFHFHFYFSDLSIKKKKILLCLQYKGFPSLVAQLVKNPPAMQETWVRSLGWEDLLEKGKATPFSILVWRIPWTV